MSGSQSAVYTQNAESIVNVRGDYEAGSTDTRLIAFEPGTITLPLNFKDGQLIEVDNACEDAYCEVIPAGDDVIAGGNARLPPGSKAVFTLCLNAEGPNTWVWKGPQTAFDPDTMLLTVDGRLVTDNDGDIVLRTP